MGSRSKSEDWDHWERFKGQAVKEWSRHVTKVMACQYLDILVERGYLIGRGEQIRATKRFADLMMQASKDLRQRDYPMGLDEDPRAPFGWEMARIVLQPPDSSRPMEEVVNPKELGGLAAIITAALQTFSISPEILREAYEAEE